MDDLITEQNHLKLQMASIFTSIEQVETQKRGENETIEEYNRHKALANLTKMHFMKQMEKLTKKFKEDTELTNLRPMPKPTNENILTKKVSTDISNNVLLPNIESNVEDELKRLGLDTKLLTTSNTTLRKEKLNREESLVSPTDSSPSSVPETPQQVKATPQTTQKMDKSLHDDTPTPPLEPKNKLQRSSQYVASDREQSASQTTHGHAVRPQKKNKTNIYHKKKKMLTAQQ